MGLGVMLADKKERRRPAGAHRGFRPELQAVLRGVWAFMWPVSGLSPSCTSAVSVSLVTLGGSNFSQPLGFLDVGLGGEVAPRRGHCTLQPAPSYSLVLSLRCGGITFLLEVTPGNMAHLVHIFPAPTQEPIDGAHSLGPVGTS